MESRARLLGHPVHQMLVPFPLGLLGGSLVFDILRFALDSDLMAVVAYYMIGAGVIAALVAAPFGAIDWLAVPRGTRARRIGALHGAGNLVVAALFAASWFLRRLDPAQPPLAALVLSFAGVGLSLVTAWLGGELVDRLGIGVSDGAHVDAPSSLDRKATGQPGLRP
jgi:uncharacterized membrane protein